MAKIIKNARKLAQKKVFASKNVFAQAKTNPLFAKKWKFN